MLLPPMIIPYVHTINTMVSQSMTLLSDFKTALYLQVPPRQMFLGQLLGASIGVIGSASTFLFVLHLR